jgi:phosphopantetheinyl transferase
MPHIGRPAAVFNQETTCDKEFRIAYVRNPDGAGLADRWATDQDYDYAASRPRSVASLTALAALRALLFLATRRTGWIVTRSPLGKPSVTTADGQDGPSVSLSHTRGMVAVAVARGRTVGIDVEHHQTRDFAALADHAFGLQERREVAAFGLDAFYRIWTLREATAKMTGDGLALVLNRTDLADDVASVQPPARRRRHLLHLLPASGYSLGVAWLGDDDSAAPHLLDLASLTGRGDPNTAWGEPTLS